jgi:hypothetical protein
VDLQQQIADVERRHDEPLARLSEAMLVAARLTEVADQLVGHFVEQARAEGASWTQIGQSMGVTKQAAQKRFVRAPQWISDQVVDLVERAQQEARELGHPYIDAEHMMLALLHQHPDAFGVAPEAVRAALLAKVVPGRGPVPAHIPFTPRAKKALDVERIAKRLGQRQVHPEHILLGILDDRKFSYLTELGVTAAAVKAWAARRDGTGA